MRRTATAITLVIATALASAPPATSTEHVSEATRILHLTNDARRQAGCKPLKTNPKINHAARRHATDLQAHHRYSHTGSDVSDPGDRLQDAGYHWRLAGENIFLGPHNAQEAVQGWLASPQHRANILNCAYRHTGIDVQGPPDHRLWVQDFATPSPPRHRSARDEGRGGRTADRAGGGPDRADR
ncbi:CAP domain-containing protein [Streptomyces sp. NPDC006743]|uniref:CAP domain-containing protein n=1 Tax=Streptomyces sp. NPDC006743 TaxID=3154480 RepID=UPI00345712EC